MPPLPVSQLQAVGHERVRLPWPCQAPSLLARLALAPPWVVPLEVWASTMSLLGCARGCHAPGREGLTCALPARSSRLQHQTRDTLGCSLLCQRCGGRHPLPLPLSHPIPGSAVGATLASESCVFSPFPYFAVTSQVSSQEGQLGQVVGGLPARKQPLPPSPVFKKSLPCCSVLGLSIPFPLRGRGHGSDILQRCSGHFSSPTRHRCQETATDPGRTKEPCPQDLPGFGGFGE